MDLKLILESLLFHAQKPMNAGELKDLLTAAVEPEDANLKALKKTTIEQIGSLLNELESDYRNMARSFRLICVAGAWQFASMPDYAPWIRALVGEKPRPPKLSQPALETLAIIAYRQPLTRAEIEQIRGVSVDGVMQTLIERGLVEAVGRAEVAGRPITYGTTLAFLEYFGLRNLMELPAADELRRIPVKKVDPLLVPTPEIKSQVVLPESVANIQTEKTEDPAPPNSTPPKESTNSSGIPGTF